MMYFQPQHIQKWETVDFEIIKYKYISKKKNLSHSIHSKNALAERWLVWLIRVDHRWQQNRHMESWFTWHAIEVSLFFLSWPFTPVEGPIFEPLSTRYIEGFHFGHAWSPDFTSFLIQVISWAKFCFAQEDSTRSIDGFHFEESRFNLVLFGKETVKTFSTNVLIRVKCSFVGRSFPTRLGTK